MRFAQLNVINEIHLAIQKAEGYIDLTLLAQKEKVDLPQSMWPIYKIKKNIKKP